jgi:hypothetical protein
MIVRLFVGDLLQRVWGLNFKVINFYFEHKIRITLFPTQLTLHVFIMLKELPQIMHVLGIIIFVLY